MSLVSVRNRSVRNSITAWAFLLPAAILIALSVLVPALMALVMSFSATGLDVTEPLLNNLIRLEVMKSLFARYEL